MASGFVIYQSRTIVSLLLATPFAVESPFHLCCRLNRVATLQVAVATVQPGLIESLRADRHIHCWRGREKVAWFQRDHVSLAWHLAVSDGRGFVRGTYNWEVFYPWVVGQTKRVP